MLREWRTRALGSCLLRLQRSRKLFHTASYELILDGDQSSRTHKNDVTINNLNINSDTRVIFQGFTGKQATFDAKHSIEYGTKIVGGVRPGKDGEHLGLPVVPSVRAAMDQLKPDATAVYVAAPHAAGAITEAIEAEVPLIVAVAEHIPLHDMLRVQQILRTQTKSRLLGANTPGMINPHARCRIGFPPIPFFKPGRVAIAAKSGTLSYETVASTTRAGLGQSMAIGIGGDPIPGTDFVDCLRVFEQDEHTEGIILVGELGGFAEEQAAEWIKNYRKRTKYPKPIMALIAGINAVPGRVMGHAGSYTGIGESTAQQKIKALEDAGVAITDHPSKFGKEMRNLLSSSTRPSSALRDTQTVANGQRRQLHTLTIRQPNCRKQPSKMPITRKRHLWLTREQCFAKLSESGLLISDRAGPGDAGQRFAITLDRQTRNLRLVFWIGSHAVAVPFDLDYRYCTEDHFKQVVDRTLNRLQLPGSLAQIITSIRQLFTDLKASTMLITASRVGPSSSWSITSASIHLDDAAYRSSGRLSSIHSSRRIDLEDADEVAAESHGIVYVKLFRNDPAASVGTLANGAGLAMNLVDALAARGGRCSNFLDTGGKATSETVRASFELILRDPRVRVVFVNIFGGLTLCDMIARGILLAYRELEIELPVVVRLRGTNEGEGQRLIAESGLPMHAFDDFEEAAAKVIELAGGTK